MSFSKLMAIMVGFILVIGGSLFMFLAMYGWNYGFGILTNSLTSIESTNNMTNISYAAELTFGELNEGFQTFRWISFLIIFAMFIGIIVSCFMVRMSGWYSLLYVLIYLILLFLSIYVSISYQDLYNAGTDFSQGLSSWQGSSYILLNLPVFISIIAAFGAIPMFVSFIKSREVE